MTNEYYGAALDAQHSVNVLLLLTVTGREQDWEFELADPARVEEMLAVYTSTEMSIDVRKAFALLLLSSVEEKASLGDVEHALLERITEALQMHPSVRDAMAFYWIDQNLATDPALLRRLLSI